MRSRRRLLATACALLLPLAAAAGTTIDGSGRVTTENRTVGSFKSISMQGSIDVVVRQSGREAVEVRADDNLLPLIETVVDGGTLRIGIRAGTPVYTRHDLKVTVDVVRLESVAGSGSGDLTIEPLKTPVLTVALSGSGDAQLRALTTDELTLRIAGSSDITVAGSAGRLKVSIAGSGDVQAKDLAADDVSISIAGSGDARVNAAKTLDVSIAGSGDVAYSGNPTLKRSVAGSGSIERR